MAASGPYGQRRMTIRNGSVQTGVVVQTLAELKEKGAPMFGLEPSNCRVQREDGTEVREEKYFSFLEEDTILIISMLYELL